MVYDNETVTMIIQSIVANLGGVSAGLSIIYLIMGFACGFSVGLCFYHIVDFLASKFLSKRNSDNKNGKAGKKE